MTIPDIHPGVDLLSFLAASTDLRHLTGRQPALVVTPTWRHTPAVRGPQTVRTVFRR